MDAIAATTRSKYAVRVALAAWDAACWTSRTLDAMQESPDVRANSDEWDAALNANSRAFRACWQALWAVSSVPLYVPAMSQIGRGE